jgi:hypothetical protein
MNNKKVNRNREWLKDYVYYEDKNVICYDNTIKLKHDLPYWFKR